MRTRIDGASPGCSTTSTRTRPPRLRAAHALDGRVAAGRGLRRRAGAERDPRPQITSSTRRISCRKRSCMPTAYRGLLVACALVRPEKANGMKVSSVKKKLKEKSFAPGVERDKIRDVEEYDRHPAGRVHRDLDRRASGDRPRDRPRLGSIDARLAVLSACSALPCSARKYQKTRCTHEHQATDDQCGDVEVLEHLLPVVLDDHAQPGERERPRDARPGTCRA